MTTLQSPFQQWDALLYGAAPSSIIKELSLSSETASDAASSQESQEEECIGGSSLHSESPAPLLAACIPSDSPKDLHLLDLPESLQLNVLQFLDVPSLRNTRQVCRSYRQRLLADTEESIQAIWKPACQRQWPWLKFDENSTVLKDSLFGGNDFPLLFKLAADKSHGIDETLFPPQRWSRSRQVFRPRRNATTQLNKILVDDKKQAVQFTGPVGTGDRCIRADEALPRPQSLSKDQLSQLNPTSKTVAVKRALKKLVPKRLRKEKPKKPVDISIPAWKPFVAPYTSAELEVHLTPRLISYFEVSILQAPEREDEEGGSNAESECVAVGLADGSFRLHNYQPGWEKHSFGFHGDDGGIYHGSGEMLKPYGPKFGVGDVVGCGVDYQQRAIFYTLNGDFLGYAFDLNDNMLNCNLFPVIGMDTHCPVVCNFGTETSSPFLFDLEALIARHQDVVLQAITMQRCSRSNKKEALR